MTDTVETDGDGELDYTYVLGKLPTSLQRRFADFILSDEVGYSAAGAKTKEEAFREGVRMAVALRIPFQASDTNRRATEEEREQRAAQKAEEAEAREAARLEAAEARAAKTKAAPAVEEVEEAPKAKPTKTTKSKAATPAATPAAAPAAGRRPAARRAPARAATATAEAPF